MKFFQTTMLVVILLAVLGGTRAHAASGAPMEQESIRTLFDQVMRVMEAMHAPLGFSGAELDSLLAPAETLTDAKTGKPFLTQHGHPMIYYVIEPQGACPVDIKRTVLFIGGIHPDEISPMYTSFHALYELITNPYSRPDNTRVVYIPLTNPEGLIESEKKTKHTTRENFRGVDLNRGFEETPAQTEPEVAFVKALIAKFNPSHIVTLHAPYGWLDYDGPAKLPTASAGVKREIQNWEESVAAAGTNPLPIESDFGAYHGSMGNYGGYKLHKHVLTIEFPSVDGKKGAEEFDDYGPAVFQALNPPMQESEVAAPAPAPAPAPSDSLHMRAPLPKR